MKNLAKSRIIAFLFRTQVGCHLEIETLIYALGLNA